MDQNEIGELLNQSRQEDGQTPADDPAAGPPPDQNGPDDKSPPTAEGTDGTDGGEALDQDNVEKLLDQAGQPNQAAGAGQTPADPPTEPATESPQPSSPQDQCMAGEGNMPQQDLDYLLNQAQEALESIDSGDSGGAELPEGVSAFRLEEFPGAPPSSDSATLDLIRDVELDLKIELGRTHMYLEDVLKLRKGSVVPLDKLAGDPVDVYVNGRLVARGEVLVLNENFCVRVTELIAGVHHT